jgi:ferric-dicitrate binding protein FerR (iron transport regulator)
VKCEAFLGVMHEYIDGLLPPAESEAARAHRDSCAACAEEMDAARRFKRLLTREGDAALEVWRARSAADRAAAAEPAGALRRFAPFAATALAAMAASVLLVLALAPSERRPETLVEGASVELSRGRHVLAAPGREIEAEGSAVLTVALGSAGERVRLESGTAFFRVEPGRAFAVETPQGVASVLGTSFHVAVARGGDVSVTVHSGRVKFAGARESVTLAAGDRLEVDPRGAQRLVGRKKMEELENSVRRANSRADAAAAAAVDRGPAATVGPDAVKAFLASDEGREILKAAVDAAQARQREEAAAAMHEGAFARFAQAADLSPDQSTRAKELLKNFGVAMRAAMTPPQGASPQERNSFWKNGYTKIYDLRKHLDDDLRTFLTPVQFDVYLRSYPAPPPAPVNAGEGHEK